MQDIQFQQLDWMMDLLKDIAVFECLSHELLELVVSKVPGLMTSATAEKQVLACWCANDPAEGCPAHFLYPPTLEHCRAYTVLTLAVANTRSRGVSPGCRYREQLMKERAAGAKQAGGFVLGCVLSIL